MYKEHMRPAGLLVLAHLRLVFPQHPSVPTPDLNFKSKLGLRDHGVQFPLPKDAEMGVRNKEQVQRSWASSREGERLVQTHRGDGWFLEWG